MISDERFTNIGSILSYLTGKDYAINIDHSFGPKDGCDIVSFFSEADISKEVKKHVVISEGFKHCYVSDKGFRSGFYTTVVFYRPRG
ncbi:hypothetical protein KAR91_00905 [Candidatus Pacearchaeota archaeon]|nr:hypothetical protein [Candidatus Pacearchaeota archaeon]